MGYGVKWVEDNLGVTRKALRIFEREGLMPKNENNKYLDYSDADIERIWVIRVLQGIGYSLKEIANIASSEDFDFQASITNKVYELKKKKADLERHLQYAQTIKFTGRFPLRPQTLGSVTFSEFQENALNEWSCNDFMKSCPYHDL